MRLLPVLMASTCVKSKVLSQMQEQEMEAMSIRHQAELAILNAMFSSRKLSHQERHDLWYAVPEILRTDISEFVRKHPPVTRHPLDASKVFP